MELLKQIDETVSFNEKNIRVIGSYNEPWFVGKDVCNILELKNISDAMKMIPEKWRGSEKLNTFGGIQEMTIINEAGLYKLIMRSNKPIAQKFQEVVCEEILPSLRKKGEYKIQSIMNKNKELEEEKLKLEEEKKILEEENKIYSNRILKKNKRQNKIGESVYIVMSEHIKDEFKVGQTDDIHNRLKAFNNASPTKFILHKIWYTRFNKVLERLIQDIFQTYRISLNNEWFKMECLDQIVEWVDIFIESVEKFDTKDLEFIKNQAPNLVFIDNNRSEKKKCSKCLLAKSLCEFYILDKNIKDEDYDLTNEEENEEYKTKKYRNTCKVCCNEENKKHRNKIKENQYYNKKECLECKSMLTYDNFYKIEKDKLCDHCITCYNKSNNLLNSKQCDECNLILGTENFGIHTGNLLRNQCKECRNKKIKEYRSKDEKVVCEFCNKEIKYKNNLSVHQKTKACVKIQEKR